MMNKNQSNIVVCDHLASNQVIALCAKQGVHHVVQVSNFDSEAEYKLASNTIENPLDFIKYPLSMIFGIENPTEESEKIHSVLSRFVTQPDDKNKILDEVDAFVARYSNSASLAYDVRLSCDELMTNSLYNAPYVDRDYNHLNPTRDKTLISVDPNRQPYIFAGTQQDSLVVGCKDFYGTLNVKKFIDRIQMCYEKSLGEMINFGLGGAGIGSYMIFDSCTRLYIAVEPFKSTTLTCVFPLKGSAQKRQAIPKNIHIILSETTV